MAVPQRAQVMRRPAVNSPGGQPLPGASEIEVVPPRDPAGQRNAPSLSFREAVDWLHVKAVRMILSSHYQMSDGVRAFPPQVGPGYEAFWLRDYAYQLEGCVDAFSDKELASACRVFIKALRSDGAAVDCVKFTGQPIYMPGYGSMGTNPVADGSQFTVDVVWHTWQRTKDRKLLGEIINKLAMTMEAAPRNPKTGLIHIKPGGWDRCPYGFTDSIRKQGDELFCSLLFIQACRQLGDLLEAAGRPSEAKKWRDEALKLAPVVRSVFWDEKVGLFRAATVLCKQPDVWGSAFAVYLDVATAEQAKTIARYFKTHYREIVQRGQIRHLPGGMYWDAGCPRNTYQNGGHWATATGWFVYTLDLVDPQLAEQTVIDVVADFRQRGVSEWVLGQQLAVMNYLSSATMPLAGVRKMLARRGMPLVLAEVKPLAEPNGPANLAYVGSGAKPATASSEYPLAIHRALGINDGHYGNDHSWIGRAPGSWFRIELARTSTIGRFRLGRDRLGAYGDRPCDALKMEVSGDGRNWRTVFQRKGLTSLPDYTPKATIEIDVAPIEARYIKVTVDGKSPSPDDQPCIDEFEVYTPVVKAAGQLPAIRILEP
jgi:hypothetical protein